MGDDFEPGLISIIIPAYNVGKYIAKCLDSLYNQDYQNFEIIVAYDEKSSDNTQEILNSYISRGKLQVDIGVDKGSGDARNRGFKFAKGEYVIFVDGDDEVTPDYLSTMINAFQQYPDLNVVLCNYIRVDEDEVQMGWEKSTASNNVLSLIKKDDLLYKKLWHQVSSAPWSYLIKRKYLLDNEINFPPYSHADDSFFSYKLALNSEYIGYCSKILYIFIQHDTSITHTLPDYWWRKYEPFARDMYAYAKDKSPDFAQDFERNIYRILAYMSARRLSYKEFREELRHYDVKKLQFLSRNDRPLVMCSVLCFNVSKRLYWTTLRVLNSIISKIYPLTQR